MSTKIRPPQTYGEEITAMLKDATPAHPNEQQIALHFEDEPDF